MRILLVAVNAKYIHLNLAVHSLKQYAEEHDSSLRGQIGLKEFTINQTREEIEREIYNYAPDLLAFSVYIWNISMISDIIGDLNQILPEVPIWLGGPEVSCCAEEFLRRCEAVSGILSGEGEETFLNLCRCYLSPETGEAAFHQLKGICFMPGRLKKAAGGKEAAEKAGGQAPTPKACGGKQPAAETAEGMDRQKEAVGKTGRQKGTEKASGENPVYTDPAPYLNMDELPFIYRDIEKFSSRILYYETSRGCPYRCSYCFSSLDRAVRMRSMELVRRELQHFLDARVRQVKLVDRTFNCSKAHAMAIWTYLRDHDNGVTNFHFEIEADILSQEEIDLVSGFRPGLARFEIGVQSTNPDALRAVKRFARWEKIRDAAAQLRKAGNIELHLDLIAGLPCEDYESFRRSFDEVIALRPHELQLGFLKILKGSAMEGEAAAYGIRWRERAPYEVLETPWLSAGDLFRLKDVENMLETFYNSGQYGRTVEHLLKLYESRGSAMALFEDLADAFARANPEGRSYSRQQNTEFLRTFIRTGPPKSGRIPLRGEDGGRIPTQLQEAGRIPLRGEDDGRIPTQVKEGGEIPEPGEDGGRILLSGQGRMAQMPEAFAAEEAFPSWESERGRWLACMDDELTCDLYLRENGKVRPSWAAPDALWKQESRAFYREEEKSRRFFPHLSSYDHKQLSGLTHFEILEHLGRRVVFDYSRRDPVTGNACMRLISSNSPLEGLGEMR